MKPTKLDCTAYGTPRLEGYGERLVFEVTAYRTTRTGRRIDYLIRFEACRHSVKQLSEAIANMQNRDREHIARQQHRLQNEVAPLQVKP